MSEEKLRTEISRVRCLGIELQEDWLLARPDETKTPADGVRRFPPRRSGVYPV